MDGGGGSGRGSTVRVRGIRTQWEACNSKRDLTGMSIGSAPLLKSTSFKLSSTSFVRVIVETVRALDGQSHLTSLLSKCLPTRNCEDVCTSVPKNWISLAVSMMASVKGFFSNQYLGFVCFILPFQV